MMLIVVAILIKSQCKIMPAGSRKKKTTKTMCFQFRLFTSLTIHMKTERKPIISKSSHFSISVFDDFKTHALRDDLKELSGRLRACSLKSVCYVNMTRVGAK